MFFCDPPGNTSAQSLLNYGRDDVTEKGFVFCHDQEPVDAELYKDLFDNVVLKSADIVCNNNVALSLRTFRGRNLAELDLADLAQLQQHKNFRSSDSHIVVSEIGANVQQLENLYGWKPHYYFFHGWACLDWFRGYDKTFLLPRARDRNPTKTFISPNRIIGGHRDHRILFLYHVFKHQLGDNYISAPKICVYENQPMVTLAEKYCNKYSDITQVLSTVSLPKLFSGETTQQMTSCWLTNFKEAQDSLVYVPTETVYFGHRLHLTEKTFKAIALEMPFVLVAPMNSLEYLRSYGFKTFHSVFDETYDQESDDFARLEKITKLLKDLQGLSSRERQQLHRACLPIVEHNYAHFYHGEFSKVLWQELVNMLNELRT